MSAGPSLYRRHRPRTFADVVGQEHVVRTLSHAVERDKVHHAYLFVGSRGTGKTSMAKILASCLNCVTGPTITPCGACDSCVSIASATSLDVIEMDAASNNSVDDIRELRDTVAFAPVSGRHKVYILDEAHMLSSAAWNAFLKTLEEPPPRTVFVLATTEANKVLATVVDRCHRFDFGRPGADQIAGLLRRVAAEEGIALEDGAAALVARYATGSYRDALGTLEQLVDYAGDAPVTTQDVLAVLGVADSEALFEAVEAIIGRDPGAALGAAAALCGSGRDPGQVLRDLESHARELLTVQVVGRVPAELSITSDRDERLTDQARRLAPTDAVRLLDLISAALEASQNGAQPRIQLELVLIRAAAPEFDPTSSALLSRLERLERGAAPVAAPPTAPPEPPALGPEPAQPEQRPAAPPPEVHQQPVRDERPDRVEAVEVEPAPAAPRQPTPPANGAGAGQMVELWPAVVELLRGQNDLLAAMLRDARPTAMTAETLTLALPAGEQFRKRKLEGNEQYRQLTAAAVRSITGESLDLVWELADGTVPAEAAVTLSEDELVRRFVEDFDAQELTDQET